MMSAALASVGESGSDMNCSSMESRVGAGLLDIDALA